MIYKDIIRDIEKNNTINGFEENINYQNDIILLFDKYFEHKENLERYSHDYLIQDYINYSNNKFNGIDNCILEVITLFNKAKSEDPQMTFNGFAQFQDISVEVGNKYWSLCKMQKNFDELEEYEYVTECFNLMENICEILIKNYFAFLVYFFRIIKRKTGEFSKIQKIRFGNLFNELKQSNQMENVLGIIDSDVTVSQWRNIACHKTYQYNKNEIICKYGEDLEKTVVVHSKKDLLNLTKAIYRISQVLNFAFKFFTYDNIYDIRAKMDDQSLDELNMRDESWHLIFVTELYANGYKVLEICDKDKLVITIQDMTEGEKRKRAIQSSIAIYKAWTLSDREKIKVIYYTRDGDPYLSFESTAIVCKKIASGEEDISYLAEKMISEKFQ